MTDVRIHTAAVRNAKVRKLRRILGRGALWSWIAMLCYAAEFRPDGRLEGLDDDDLGVALDLDEDEDPRPVLAALERVGLLDRDGDLLVVHDWEAWNSFAANAPARKLASQIANHKRALKRGTTTCDPETCNLCRSASQDPNRLPDRSPNRLPRVSKPVTESDSSASASVTVTASTTSRAQSAPASDAFRLAELLLDLHHQRDSKFRPAKDRDRTLATWSTDFEKLLRIDGRTPDEVERVIRFVVGDAFEAANVQSGRKIRERFDGLIAKARRGQAVRPAALPAAAPRRLYADPAATRAQLEALEAAERGDA